MKQIVTIIGRLTTLALLAVFLVPTQVRAQEEVSLVFHTISWGMVRGQTARFTVLNPHELLERERLRMIFVQVMLFDASGAVIATSDEIAIPPGEFGSVGFNRDDLPISDNAGGRLQTRARVRYRSFSIVDRTQLVVFPTSIELIDDLTGQTAMLVSSKPQEIVVVGSPLPHRPAVTELSTIVYASRGLIGLTELQSLRVNALYPGDPAADPHSQPARVRARVSLYDANAALLARSAEATITRGEFHSFDFDRADISAAGETAGGRLQMRVSLEVTAPASAFAQTTKETGPLATSLELFENGTGRTTAVWVTIGFFEVAPPRNPQ